MSAAMWPRVPAKVKVVAAVALLPVAVVLAALPVGLAPLVVVVADVVVRIRMQLPRLY